MNRVNVGTGTQYKQQQIVKYETPTTVVLKTGVLWVVTPCGSAYVRINVYEETVCQTIRRHIPENGSQKLNPLYCLKLKNIHHLEIKFRY